MSSLVAHLAMGAAVGLARPGAAVTRAGLVPCMALAIAPDLDYPLWWLTGLQLTPRITHSLVFCVVAVAMVVWASRVWRVVPVLPPLTLLLAAGSHLLLDFLVGVHGLPLAWPLSDTTWRSPVGLLPSAGRLSLGNVYLWRNLLIECGVLLPLLALGVALARRQPLRPHAAAWLSAALVTTVCLAWSISLPR